MAQVLTEVAKPDHELAALDVPDLFADLFNYATDQIRKYMQPRGG
jgi:hypothetical protein